MNPIYVLMECVMRARKIARGFLDVIIPRRTTFVPMEPVLVIRISALLKTFDVSSKIWIDVRMEFAELTALILTPWVVAQRIQFSVRWETVLKKCLNASNQGVPTIDRFYVLIKPVLSMYTNAILMWLIYYQRQKR